MKGKRGKREAARADIGSPSTSVTDAQQSTTIVEHTDAKDVIVSAWGLSNKAKKKLKFKATLDPAAVQTTWAEMQSNEQRSDPQGFASIGMSGMMLVNAALLESLLGEAPGTFSHVQ